MALGLAWFLVANAATLLGARAMLRRSATGDPALDAVLFIVLRLLLLSLAILVAGLSGMLAPLPLGLAGAAGLALLVLLGEHRSLVFPKLPAFGALLGAIVAVVAVRLLLQVWFFAPYNSDALSYHLTKVAEWVRAGAFTREMGVDTHAPFPAGFELVETWWVVFLRHDVLIELAGLEFLVLAFASVVALARRAGLGERASLFAGLIYALTPGVHLSATSSLNDVPVAALVLAAAALVAGRARLPWVLLTLGLGMGVKPTFGYALPGIALVAWLVRRGPKAGPAATRLLWTAAGLGIAAGAFWYARNWIWYGNPIHPVGTEGLVGGTGALKIQFGPSLASGFRNLRALLDVRLHDQYIAYGPLLTNISGWGPLAFGVGLLALLVELRSNAALRPLAAGLGLSLLSVLFLVNHDSWFFRFVLFFPALPAIAAASLAARLRPVRVLSAAALAFQFVATTVPVDLPMKHLRVLARMGWRERSMAEAFGARAPEDAVAWWVREPIHNRGECYLLYGPDFAKRVVHLRGHTPETILGEMERSGARWLYAARDNPPREAVLDECVRRGFLRRARGRLYVRP